MPHVAASLVGRIRAQADQTGIGLVRVPIGATGAVGTITQGRGLNVAVSRTGTGAYSVSGLPFGTRQYVQVCIVSSAGTVRYAYLTASSASAGTCAFTCAAAGGAATDPANGDSLVIQYQVDA